MAKNKDVQDKLRAEIEEVSKKHNGQLTYDAIMEMTYLERVIYGKKSCKLTFGHEVYFCN